MKLTIRRGETTDQGTFGCAFLDDGGAPFDSLELPWKANECGASCIPPGVYKAQTRTSPHFGVSVYEILDVPGRTSIEIHPGNWAGDITLGLYSDLLGCVALGRGVGVLQPPETGFVVQKALMNSRKAFDEFMQRTGGQPLDIEIIEG
jgi:hypothetical protein